VVSGTAALMIFEDPSAMRRYVKNVSRFAASADEYGCPAPGEFGYSCKVVQIV
jgi:hypothetical protein